MHKYRNNKLPKSFAYKLTDITCTDELQTRHNDFNYVKNPAIKKNLESFPLKCIKNTWNSLYIE